MDPVELVLSRRSVMLTAQSLADDAAADYREAVAIAAEHLRAHEGLSQRKIAARLGLAESSLRQLLRPAGARRRR